MQTLRIAVASTDGTRVDQHFGPAEDFFIYDVTAAGPIFAEQRSVTAYATEADADRRETIGRMLSDCPVLLLAKIGVAPQEKLATLGIDACDDYAGKPIPDALQTVFATRAQAAADAEQPLESSQFRLMHAMLRVNDMSRSLDFYTRLLGMNILELREHKKNQFTQAYLGYGTGFDGMALELVQNWGREEPYSHGESFGHIAVRVTGIHSLCARLSAAGISLPRPPRGQRHGNQIVAFAEDPDGHRIELVQDAVSA